MALDPLARFRMDGRTVVITGASSGFGDRFARVLHAVGANVVLAARRIDRLDSLAAELEAERPGSAHWVAADVADPAACEALVDAALERFGRIDVLINNAGTSDPMTPAEDQSIEEWRRVMAVNLDAPFLLSSLCAKKAMLPAASGVIVNVSSIMGLVGIGQTPQAAYQTSKAGLVNLTRELAAQWARQGIRVNALAPGFFPTDITADLFNNEFGLKFLRRRTPLGRGGAEAELDGALLLLATDAGSYMTGSTLVIDGGWTAI